MKAKKIVIFIVLYAIFVAVAFEGTMKYHDYKEAKLVNEFCQRVRYEPDEIYYDYFEGTFTWCPKDDTSNLRKITNQDYSYSDMLDDFEKNEKMYGVVFVAVFLIGALGTAKIVFSICNK
jgi:hypothetical protein